MIKPNISALSVTSSSEIRAPAALVAFFGSAVRPNTRQNKPMGMLMTNSHGQEATDKIAAAIDGPATDAVATIIELMATPRPSS